MNPDRIAKKIILEKDLLESSHIVYEVIDYLFLNDLLADNKQVGVEPEVKPDACEGWRKEKPNKPCYFIHRYNRKDNKPSIFEAVIDGGVLVVANIQDDEFVETMDDFADGDFFIIEKY